MNQQVQQGTNAGTPTDLSHIAEAIMGVLLRRQEDLPSGWQLRYSVEDLSALSQMIKKQSPPHHRVHPKHHRIPEGPVLLWHGTSLYRAVSIMESGFRNSRKRGVYFSTHMLTCIDYAAGKAQKDQSEPAIFAAYQDLRPFLYGKHFHTEDHVVETHYIFRAAIASRIVQYLVTCNGLYATGQCSPGPRRWRDDLTPIVITPGAGRAGIAYWLSALLDLDEDSPIPITHPSIDEIQSWIDKRSAEGRTEPIADEELLPLVCSLFPDHIAGIPSFALDRDSTVEMGSATEASRAWEIT